MRSAPPAVLIAFAGALSSACAPVSAGSAGAPPSYAFAGANDDRVAFGVGRTRMFLAAHGVEYAWVARCDAPLRPGARLEFLPLVDGAEAGELTARVEVIRRGRVDRLGTFPAVSAAAPVEDARFYALRALRRADLSRYAGQPVELRFELFRDGAPASGAIALARLRDAATERGASALLFCSDTHRYDRALGPEGRDLMPRLDALARRSLVFDDAYAAASWTLPSIATLLTGLWPRHHQTGRRVDAPANEGALSTLSFGSGSDGEPVAFTAFPRELETLPERLRAAGWRTALVTTNPLYMSSGLYAAGFDLVLEVGVEPGERAVEAARRALESQPTGEPLFLVTHLLDVHHWQPWYFDPVRAEGEPLERESLLAAYDEAVRAQDGHLGDLLDLWDERFGIAPSLVAFCADHGECLLEEPELVGHGRGMRDELLHVPLVVHAPERLGIEPRRVARRASLADLAPTVLELLGLPVRAVDFDGRSLLDPEGSEPRTLFAEFQLYESQLASVRRGDRKLVIDLDAGTRELVDVSRPGERRVDEPEVERALFDAYRMESPRALAAGRTADETMRSALDALGYVDAGSER